MRFLPGRKKRGEGDRGEWVGGPRLARNKRKIYPELSAARNLAFCVCLPKLVLVGRRWFPTWSRVARAMATIPRCLPPRGCGFDDITAGKKYKKSKLLWSFGRKKSVDEVYVVDGSGKSPTQLGVEGVVGCGGCSCVWGLKMSVEFSLQSWLVCTLHFWVMFYKRLSIT